MSACGQPTVVPAGSVGLEVSADQATTTERVASAPASAPGEREKSNAQTTARKAPPPTVAKQRASIPEPSRPTDPLPRAASKKALKPASKPAAAAAAPLAAKADTAAALPRMGTYTYRLTGSSSLGPPPRTSTLTVADGGSGDQLWTLDQRREDGAGLIEELTLRREKDGIYLSAYRLDASTGIAGVVLVFKPDSPVLLTPAGGTAGTTWRFDLGTSTDGCATAKGVGALLDAGDARSARTFRLSTTLQTVGSAGCVQLDGERVQEISHPRQQLLPTLIDSNLRGTVAGVAFRATTEATRSPSEHHLAPDPQGSVTRIGSGDDGRERAPAAG
jgi:hypothetical protein